MGKTVGEFACRWVIGGFDWPMAPFDFVPQLHPAGVEVTRASVGKALGPMLDAGEIDALISADVPACVIEGSPDVTRLFDDYRQIERDYYLRTGIFPIMHTVVIRRDLVARRPGLARSVYDAFCAAKGVVAQRYRAARTFNHIDVMMPWFSARYDDDLSLFGPDWWPYGVAANRTTLDAFLRWHFEQGLSQRRLTCEDIFVEELIGT